MKGEEDDGGKGGAVNDPPEIGQRSFEFAARVVEFCRSVDQSDYANTTIVRQLIRSGTSVGANIEEGKGSQSRADFLTKYSIALKEARETHYWLRLIVRIGVTPASNAEFLIGESDKLVRILTSIVKKIKATT